MLSLVAASYGRDPRDWVHGELWGAVYEKMLASSDAEWEAIDTKATYDDDVPSRSRSLSHRRVHKRRSASAGC